MERQAIEGLAVEKAVEWDKVHEAVKIAEWQRHKKLIALADEMLARWEKNKAKCGTLEGIARVLELATKLGRLAAGMPTEVKEVNTTLKATIDVEWEIAIRKAYGQVADATGQVGAGATGGGRRRSGEMDAEEVKAMNERETYFVNAAVAAGCPEDQTRNFVAAQLWLQERQLAASAAARLCDRPDGPTAIGYGGARGGGKSHWLLAQMGADDCQRVPGLKCLLLRKVGKANLEHFEDLRRKLFNRLPHEFSAFRGVLTFANGSRIIAGHFQNEKDIDAYLGLEYDVIGIEEATTLTRRKYQDITTCCRSSKPNWRPRIYSTTNPGRGGSCVVSDEVRRRRCWNGARRRRGSFRRG